MVRILSSLYKRYRVRILSINSHLLKSALVFNVNFVHANLDVIKPQYNTEFRMKNQKKGHVPIVGRKRERKKMLQLLSS